MNPKQMLFVFGTLANVKRDRSNDEYIADSLSKSSTGLHLFFRNWHYFHE